MKQSFLSILLMLLPMLASADAVEIDGIWYNLVLKAKVAEVTSNRTIYGSVEIPESVTKDGIEYKVTSIGEWAFSGSSLISITIPNSVTSIGEYAFKYCESLTSITIPNSVTRIGEYAFDCSDLTASVHISDLEAWCRIDFTNAASNPLNSCHHLYLNGKEIKDLVIPNSVTSIGQFAFAGCSGLTSITIPSSVTSIGSAAFEDCSGLTSVTIPNSVTSIGAWAFCRCSGLPSIKIPNSVTSIGQFAFAGCSGLISVIIPNNVTNIGSSAFSGCTSLNSVTILNSVTSIDSHVFWYCTSLTSITIPTSVTRINSDAFANCNELTDVYCLAEKLRNGEWSGEGLYTHPDAFKDSYPQYTTLHVPATAFEAYRSTEPWMNFKAIVTIEEGDIPEIQKCATPIISFVDGKVSITCETEGAGFVSEVTVGDAKQYYNSEYTLSQVYTITAYATKPGYNDSDKATLEVKIPLLKGDLNGDDKVDVADHVELSKIILKQ